METTPLEFALEIGLLSGLDIKLKDRQLRDEIRIGTSIDDLASGLDSAKGIRGQYGRANLAGITSEEQEEIAHGDINYLLFDRISEIKRGFGLRYVIRIPKSVNPDIKETDRRIRDKDYDYELITIHYNPDLISTSVYSESEFFSEAPIFYFHVSPQGKIFAFDILAKDEEIPVNMMAAIEEMKATFNNKIADIPRLVKSLVELMR